jgi:ATP-dependent Lhr-like helicase
MREIATVAAGGDRDYGGRVDALARFGPVTRAWFAESFAAPTRVQAGGWASIAGGDHTLMLAPTGSGKTLAAFLWCLDRLSRETARGVRPRGGVQVVYVSPLKALAYDVEKNLRAPLIGMGRVAARDGVALAPIRIDVRTGDTPPKERERQRREPGEILITTPESLYLILGSRAREGLTGVHTVIVDEIHALAPTKRGSHTAITLERLSQLVTSRGNPEPQRIGLSATQKPLDEVARYLGGDRAVTIVDAGERPRMDLEIIVPVPDMTAPPPPPEYLTTGDGNGGKPGKKRGKKAGRSLHAATGEALGGGPTQPSSDRGMWPSIYPLLLDLVLQHRSTILFVNSRRLAERLSQQLTELAIARGDVEPNVELVRAHHGSVARLQREQIEEELKSGRLRAITATSSLELGIDMGAVDLVVQIESPGAVSRGLQRIGRAGHAVGGTSIGRIVPKFRGDLLEAAVVARKMLDGEVEAIRVPENALDVLAQQVVAMCSVETWTVDDLERVVRRAASYRNLGRSALAEVLDMLSGRYPSDDFAELRPRITWDRTADTVTARRGARLLSVVNAGTIPDRGLFSVVLGPGGPRVGELDEEMVHESRPGETFILGATTWRIEEIDRDRVIVSPAPGEPGKMPFWRGEGPGRPVELGRSMGAFVRTLDGLLASDAEGATRWLREEHRLDALAAQNLIAYVGDQRAASGTVPTDQAITVERFRDELGDWRVCMLTPFGGRVHAPWALALERRLEDKLGYPIHPLWTDDGIAFRFADGDELPTDEDLFPEPEDIDDILVTELSRSSVFASHFRENAARALLLPRRRPGMRTPLWSQRLRAQQLLGVALRYPSFPIVLETYRECLRDVFDVPALRDILGQVRSRAIRIESAETNSASPFARSLVFDYVAAYLYEGDAPLAERKAQALTLDRTLLRELLGDGELRDLLDAQVVIDVDDLLQQRSEGRRARDPDEVHDLLRRLGDLTTEEVAARSEGGDAAAWLGGLESGRRVAQVRIGGEARWIAVEDAARYRDGLGVVIPPGLPAVFLAAAEAPVEGLLLRWARTHAPFPPSGPASRWGLPVAQVEALLRGLVASGQLISGELLPGGAGLEYCDADVLRQLRRKTLARLRAEVAPVDADALGRFLPRWHGIGAERRGLAALREAIIRLEGAPLSFAELEARLLPARVLDFQPRLLDELGAMGELVWIGRGALGPSDGRIAIYRRERVSALVEPAALDPAVETDVHRGLVAHLRTAGASFLVALEEAVPGTSREQVRAALWDLVFAGMVTNDTFAPLRSLKAPAGRAGRRVSAGASFGGRWSLVEEMLKGRPAPTARTHAQAVGLLDRWGIVAREAAIADGVPGGFAAVVDVLRAMEDAGSARRGYFVEGISGSQFAWPGAIDRLRAERDAAAEAVVLAAVDPANPWGSVVAWPQTTNAEARPSRRVGATVVMVGGRPALFVEARGKRIVSFAAVPDDAMDKALADGLRRVARSARRRQLAVEIIDGGRAQDSPLAPRILAAGGRADYRGLVVDADPLASGRLSIPVRPAAAVAAIADDGDGDGDGDGGEDI